MDINEIKDLLARFDASSLTEFDLREGSFELYMNKNNSTRQAAPAPAEAQLPAVAPAVTAPAVVPTAETPVVVPAPAGEEILSPIVGVVYLKPAPDKANFKEVGDPVKKGDVLCIVEAMKLMNEIASDVDGVITEVLVANEAVVEYNQPLFRIAKGE